MFTCFRRTTVFSVLLGVVIGFSVAYCFVIVNYCVDVWKYKTHNKVIVTNRVFNKTITKHRRIETLLSATAQSILHEENNHIKCDNKPLQSAFKQRGQFWVLYNYVQADEQFNCDETITYATHGDYTFLDNLAILAERWQGPISVALYAPGYDFNATLDAIAHLRNCGKSSLIRTFVSFHVFFGYKDIPDVVRKMI